MQSTTILPTVTLARHETFHLRDAWIPKALHALRDDAAALTNADAHHELGVGKNMLTAIRYWTWAAGLVFASSTERRQPVEYKLTRLGRVLLDRDPFFEDERSFWLWHIEVASSRERATFWYWLFNEYSGFDFGENEAVEGCASYVAHLGHNAPSRSSVKKDLHALLRTYVSQTSRGGEETVSPLCSLELLRAQPNGPRYRFNFDREKAIDPRVVAYALSRFLEVERPGQFVTSLEELRWAPRSPGRLLCLDTRALVEVFSEVERTYGLVTLTQTAGLRSVQFNGTSSEELLEGLYSD